MPLAPLLFYFTNFIEFAFLGSRRVKHSRRILGLKAADIGKWDSIIVFINAAAVITNGFLMIITHGSLPDFLVYNSSFAKIRDSCGETYALIIFEHAIIAYMFIVHFSVPDTPQMVQFKHYATSQVVAKTFHVNLTAEKDKDRARPSNKSTNNDKETQTNDDEVAKQSQPPTRRVTTQFNEHGAWLNSHRFVNRACITSSLWYRLSSRCC
jgi:hypothetical protein